MNVWIYTLFYEKKDKIFENNNTIMILDRVSLSSSQRKIPKPSSCMIYCMGLCSRAEQCGEGCVCVCVCVCVCENVCLCVCVSEREIYIYREREIEIEMDILIFTSCSEGNMFRT